MDFKIMIPTAVTKALIRLNRTLECLTEDYETYLRAVNVAVPLRRELTAEEQRVEISYVDEEGEVLDEIKRELGNQPKDEGDV